MRVHLPIKTAMEERQARERERYMRPIARAASGDCKMSFYTVSPLNVLVRRSVVGPWDPSYCKVSA